MPYLDHSAQVLLVLMLPGVIIGLGASWMSYRTRVKGIDALKLYAEQCREPPASLMEALRPCPAAAPRLPTRGEQLSQFTFSLVLGLGAAGFAWWRYQLGDTGLVMLLAVVCAVVFAGIAASFLAAMLASAAPARAARGD